ncbi:nucleotidyltransferase family protein [Micromonospora mirobrigensis]|uniref:Uncharacterized nucleotidyltransferase n=1 Tax=Micromonospora mirobrigensis TaxID=262898 RepID=A0A1C4Z4W9_9ACTN|nr:nucleotidyltransferase family protein [Micromonospora mirobrigensis]SCF27927.1 Uncharacterised nucleotidyltransferase [Micromonospora mirobrigensis]
MTAAALPDAVRCLALDEAAVRTSAALHADGIDSLLLKGAGLARHLGTAPVRRYIDVDLLVAPEAFDAARTVLDGLGYRSVMPGARPDDWVLDYEQAWTVPGPGGLVVDLHRGFHGVRDPDAFWAALSATAVRIPLAGGVVAVPDRVGAALLVALHAAMPGRSTGPRADLERALEVFPPDVWSAAADLAGRTRATAMFDLGLRRVEAGARLAERLGPGGELTTVEWLTGHRGSGAAHLLARAAELPTRRQRLRYLARRLVPSPAAMRYGRPLAGRGRAGLTLAYLARFTRATWQVPRAVPELRRAARLARRDVAARTGAGRPRARRSGGVLPALARQTRRYGPAGLRVAAWTVRAHRLVRRQLADGGLAAVRLSAPPSGADRGLVRGVLRRTGANCLERSLVLQRFDADRGAARVLVIGVTAPRRGFHAHAWLDGDADQHRAGMQEILRRPAPAGWFPAGQDR